MKLQKKNKKKTVKQQTKNCEVRGEGVADDLTPT